MSKRLAIIVFALAWPVSAFAGHPLVTDDAGTLGKGKLQFELTGEYARDKEEQITLKSFTFPMIPFLSYGMADTIDIMFGVPYTVVTTEEAGTRTRQSGLLDASIQMKARFYEKDGLSLAVKPGISLPAGDENKGLGSGETSYSVFFIITRDAAPWAFHFNLGYLRSEYKHAVDEDANRKDLWHVSLASQVEVTKDLKAVANVGMARNSDKTSNTYPAFVLGGFIYSLNERLDVDAGVKAGLNKAETDYALLAGLTYRH